MSKTLLFVLVGVLLLFALTNSSFERWIAKTGNNVGETVAEESVSLAESVATSIANSVDSLRVAIAQGILQEKNEAYANREGSVMTFVWYLFLALISIFFVYKILYYALVVFLLYLLFKFIRERYW